MVAITNIDKGDFIIEYIGEVVRREVSEVREKKYNAKVMPCTLCGYRLAD